MYLRKYLTLLIIFLQVFENWTYTLSLPELKISRSHAWNSEIYAKIAQDQNRFLHSRIESNVPLNTTAWNWRTPTFPQPSLRRNSDWSWNENSMDSSAAVGKSLQFQVSDDRPSSVRSSSWRHEDNSYDPYAFQHRNRHALGHHQTQVHVHNHLDSYPSQSQQSYEWQDLKPFNYFQNSHYPPYRHLTNLPSNSIHGATHFGSGVSSSAPMALGSSSVPGNVVVASSQASSQGHSFPGGYGWPIDIPRHYGHYHHHPIDYKRRRYRLEVHPGIIAAPIAGLAAFGVAHAFTSKPVLFELGLVDKKKGFPHHHHPHPPIPPNAPPLHHIPPHHHHHPHPPIPPIAPPFHHTLPHHHHNPIPTNPHFHPQFHDSHRYQPLTPKPDSDHHPVNSVAQHSQEPIKYPVEKPSDGNEATSKPWWSPFAAMIPRLRDDVERD